MDTAKKPPRCQNKPSLSHRHLCVGFCVYTYHVGMCLWTRTMCLCVAVMFLCKYIRKF